VISIIDRYIAKNFIIYFMSALAVFLVLFVAVDYLSNMSSYPVDGVVIRNYYLFSSPQILYQMFPISAVVAAVFTISSLNKNSELVALFSMGMSLARVSAPVLVLVSLLGSMAFVASDKVLPKFQEKKDYTYWVEVRKRPGMFTTVKTDRIWYRSGNILFNIKSLGRAGTDAQGATFYYFDSNWQMVQMIMADRIAMDGQKWLLKQGKIHLFPAESSFPLIETFEEKLVQIDEELTDIQTDTSSADRLGLSELKRFIEKNKDAGVDTLQFEVSYHSKYAYAFTGLVLVLLSIPFCVKRGRSASLVANLGVCIGLIFLFWILYSSFQTLAKFGSLPPILGAWAANLLLGGLSIYLIAKTKY
jgi:lipopolysaccharide export system permease protein